MVESSFHDVIEYLEHKRSYAVEHKLGYEIKRLTAMIDCCYEVLALIENNSLK